MNLSEVMIAALFAFQWLLSTPGKGFSAVLGSGRIQGAAGDAAADPDHPPGNPGHDFGKPGFFWLYVNVNVCSTIESFYLSHPHHSPSSRTPHIPPTFPHPLPAFT